MVTQARYVAPDIYGVSKSRVKLDTKVIFKNIVNPDNTSVKVFKHEWVKVKFIT